MVRAANTGVTCFIGTDGRIRPGDRLADARTGSVFVEGVLSREISLERRPPLTFYARHGDVFSVTLLAISGLAALIAAFRFKGTA